MPSVEHQTEELTRLLEAKARPLASLYKRPFDGYRVYSFGEAGDREEDEEPPFRLMAPPVTEAGVKEAERQLAFTLPPLLRAVYTCIGNVGYCLRLIGAI